MTECEGTEPGFPILFPCLYLRSSACICGSIFLLRPSRVYSGPRIASNLRGSGPGTGQIDVGGVGPYVFGVNLSHLHRGGPAMAREVKFKDKMYPLSGNQLKPGDAAPDFECVQ